LSSSRIFTRLGETVKLSTPPLFVELFVRKCITNLTYWARDGFVVKKTLDIFKNLATGLLSSKILVKLDLVEAMLTHHTAQHFPFLNFPENSHNRTSYYEILSRLLFANEHVDRFPQFTAPFREVIEFLHRQTSVEELKQEKCKFIIIGLLRDLRGVVMACLSRAHVEMVWEWIYPSVMVIFAQFAALFYDTPSVISPLLKFAAQLAENRNSRLNFECSSANGILVFRSLSAILVAYGSKLKEFDPPSQDRYKYKLKGIHLMLNILTKGLIGNYVNFGVFELYGDPCLSDALNICLGLILNVPYEELTTYPKILSGYYSFIQVLCQHHIKYVALLDTGSFYKILHSIQEGITSIEESTTFPACCTALDNLSYSYYVNRNKDNDIARGFNRILQEFPDMFFKLLSQLFQVLVYVDSTNHWSVSRTILNLILINPQRFSALTEEIINAQPIDKRATVKEAFQVLMKNVDLNLLPDNRERFTSNLTAFRHQIKNLILPH